MAEPEMNIPKRDIREETTPELIGDLVHEFTELVNEEMAMAKAELGEKIGSAALAAGLVSGSMVAALMTLGAATALTIVSLALVVATWLSALIVTGFWALVTAAMLLIARQRARNAMPPVPEKTVQTLKEDARWVRKPTGSNSK